MSFAVLEFKAHFAQMHLRFVILEDSNNFLQEKTAVDDRLQTIWSLSPETCPVDRLCCQ